MLKPIKPNPEQKTNHHTIPVSRITKKAKQTLGKKIIRKARLAEHEAWHYVFSTLTPYEAILFVIMRLAPKNCFRQATIKVKWSNCQHQFKLGEKCDKNLINLIDSVKPKSQEKYDRCLSVLFGDRDWCDVIATIVTKWAPEDYFTFVDIETNSPEGINRFLLVNSKSRMKKINKR
jgi:hypothetical protein